MAIPIPSRQLFTDGEWRYPVLKKRIPIVNPATEEIVGIYQQLLLKTSKLQWMLLAGLSRNKENDWASASGAFRAKFLRAIAAKILERKSELAKLEVVDTGKPLDEATSDMDSVAACFKHYAELAEALDAKQRAPISLPMQSFKGHVLKEPIGVVALITPWHGKLLLLWPLDALLY